MDRSIFGWGLPPGCSAADVERAMNPAIIDDAFGVQAELTKEERSIWEEESVQMLVSKALEWAYEAGYKARGDEDRETAYHKEMFDKTRRAK